MIKVLPGVIAIMEKIDNQERLWREMSKQLTPDAEKRRIRIAIAKGLVEEGEPIQNPARWAAYRLTPRGMAIVDAHRVGLL